MWYVMIMDLYGGFDVYIEVSWFNYDDDVAEILIKLMKELGFHAK